MFAVGGGSHVEIFEYNTTAINFLQKLCKYSWNYKQFLFKFCFAKKKSLFYIVHHAQTYLQNSIK